MRLSRLPSRNRPHPQLRSAIGKTFGAAVFVLSLAVIVFLAPEETQARWATATDLPAVTEFDRTQIYVDAVGRSRMIRELQLRVVNDQGREHESVQNIPFNARAQKLKILEARTINGGKSQEVSRKNIEFKEVGDFARSFDAIKQANLTYPNVQIGSKIYLKYEMDMDEVALPGFFSLAFDFGQEFTENFSVRIESLLPLYEWVNDPDGSFEIRKSTQPQGKKKAYILEARSRAPIIRQTAQEETPYIRPERNPMIAVSSLPGWDGYAKSAIPQHEALLSKKLPESMERIRREAAEEKTELAKLQKVASLISQEFRYFGDWRRRHGGYIPRTLDEIADSRYGDCKDLSLAAAALYRALGFSADIAWVYRGDIPINQDAYKIPVDVLFNHAIVRVKADGRTYWIDATNPVSFVKTPFSDIAGRPAFVLSRERPELDFIPELKSDSSVYATNLVYELQPNLNLKVKGDLKLAGRSAIGMTVKGFYNPVEAVNYELIRLLALNGKVLDSSVGEFERRSRIVTDLEIPVQFTLSDIGLRTSAGFGFPLMREDVVTRVMTDLRERVSDIYLDIPSVSRSVTEVAGVKRVGNTSLDCDLKSEWIELSRKVTDTPRGVKIVDIVDTKKSVIPYERFKTEDFVKFQDAARYCFNRAAVILEKR